MDVKEKLLSSKILYRGKILRLKLDRVELPNGRITVRETVKHPNSVAVIPVNKEGKLILIAQYRHSAGEVLLEVPAGTMREGEPAEECARRELREETGYEAGSLKELLGCYLAPGYSTEFIRIFLATNLRYKGQKLESNEQIKLSPITLEEAIEKVKKGEIKDAKTISSLLFLRLVKSEEPKVL
ncbi:TPA: NUDIX hydrolase [Candidatus Bathyarchaeota archaeon]|nr:NUDIX hydrolase [Candidatus Bathyarchaeota archaeon]